MSYLFWKWFYIQNYVNKHYLDTILGQTVHISKKCVQKSMYYQHMQYCRFNAVQEWEWFRKSCQKGPKHPEKEQKLHKFCPKKHFPVNSHAWLDRVKQVNKYYTKSTVFISNKYQGASWMGRLFVSLFAAKIIPKMDDFGQFQAQVSYE